MGLNFVVDSFYILGSLWGGMPETQVCQTSPHPLPGSAYEVAPSRVLQAAAGVTAFVDVNIVPMDAERVLPNYTVLVEGERITALGPIDKVRVPAGAIRIDGRGKYLMPGLVDMHAHFSRFSGEPDNVLVRHLFSYLAHGVTAIRQIGGGAGQYMRFRSTDVLGPRLYLAPSIDELSYKRVRLDDVTAEVGAYKAAGYNFVEAKAAQYLHGLAERRALVDSFLTAARRFGLPVASHDNTESFDNMLAYGIFGGSVDHMYAFWGGSRNGQLADTSVAGLRAVAAATKRAGTWITPTLVCSHSQPGLRPLMQALQQAGVGLLLGADADGGGGRRSPNVIHAELAHLVQVGGLTPYQALVTGTRNPAQYMELLDSTGTVTVGKRADLVLLSGNPLQDIRHTREPAGVMIRGRWLDRATLDQGLLASPTAWLKSELSGSYSPQPIGEQRAKLQVHYQTFEMLTDSLTKVASPTYERVLQLLAAELGAMRTALTPEQHVVFDPIARVWLHEQIRQGYHVTVSGLAPRR